MQTPNFRFCRMKPAPGTMRWPPPPDVNHQTHARFSWAHDTHTPRQMQNVTEIMMRNTTEIMFVRYGIIGNCFKDVATSISAKL